MIIRDSCLQPDTRNSLGISGNVLEGQPAPSEPPATFFGNSRSMASAPREPVSLNTGRPAERAYELERTHLQNFAIPTPGFARKLSTRNPHSQAERAYPQNCMVELPRNQVSEMHFDKFRDLSALQCWKTSFKTEVCSCSSFPSDAVLWIKEVEMVEPADDLLTSQSIGGHRCPNFEVLDALIASRSSRTRTSRIWERQRRRCKTDFSADDRLLK